MLLQWCAPREGEKKMKGEENESGVQVCEQEEEKFNKSKGPGPPWDGPQRALLCGWTVGRGPSTAGHP